MTAMTWKARLVDSGGYDCMTDAIHIETDIRAPSIAVLDLSHYGQKPCTSPTPETLADAWSKARLIIEAPAMRELLTDLVETYHLAELRDGDIIRLDHVRALLARIDGQETT